jgi:hypothetical protein
MVKLLLPLVAITSALEWRLWTTGMETNNMHGAYLTSVQVILTSLVVYACLRKSS